MKLKKKFITCLSAVLGASAVLLSGVAIGLVAEARSPYGDAFDYTQSVATIKYKTMQSDSSDPTKKGLLLYAYDSGASAEFKADFSGVFNADLKALNNGNSPDLTKYSLVFTDKATEKQFAVTVVSSGSYNDVYVNVEGQKAGVYYHTTQYDVNGTAYGFTGAYNNAGSYTRYADGGSAELQFDPQSMQVKLMGDGGAYKVVWDFMQEYNDGKQLLHDLPKFGEYTVEIVFDEIKTNGKGELLVYSFGGYTFNSAYIENKPNLTANVEANAIVGEEYTIPTAIANDIIAGELPSENVSVDVYDVYGNVVNDGAYTFTPDQTGEYFLYYTYRDGEASASAFYRINALAKSEISQSFVYDDAAIDALEEVGLMTTAYVPVGTVESSLSVSGYAVDTSVTIKKDGTALENYAGIAGGFAYTFEQLGTYEIVYQTDVYGVLMQDVKTVVVSADISTFVVEEIPQDVEYLSTITVSSGTLYRGDRTYDTVVTVKYPSGKVVTSGEVTLDELGYYTVTHEANGEVYEQRFAARQLYSEMFSDNVSASYGVLTGNNTIDGQLLSLTDGTEVVYSKLIDLSDNSFDDTLADKSQNTPLVELFMQPKTLGISDLQGLYITLTDKYDANNYIVIRMKYLSYMPNNLRIRTMATGQSWVGYYYDFMTAEISVDSAPSHEDGGTVVSLNPGHTIAGKIFEESKLRLYFDNENGRLYTRTWQDKAGNSTADNIIPTPWLVRDYKTNDRLLSAGDTPWKGFTTGEVYFSIYATGVTDTADILIRNIDGEDLTQKYVSDTTPPTITVDVTDEVPTAEVGTAFKVFDYTATDTYAAVVEKDVKVFRGSRELTLDENGSFEPTEVGVYKLVYTAKDAFGNVGTKEISVEAKNSLSAPQVVIDGEMPENVMFGQTIVLPSYSGQGGAGGIKTSVTVTAVDAGETIEIKNGQFVCSEEGTYMIAYTATDYIGKTKTEYQWIYGVARMETPVFNENLLVLPKAFIAGDSYVFDEYTALYYDEECNAEDIKAKITVTDAKGEDQAISGAYTPTASDTVNTAIVKLTFERSGAQTAVVEREVPILTIKQGLGFLSGFFVTENATVEAKNDAIYFTANDDGMMDFSFAKQVNQKYLSFNMKRDTVKSFNTLNITLRDIYDGNAVVHLTYYNNANTLTFSVNGGVAMRANFDTSGNFAIKYDVSSYRIFDVLGMQIGTISTYANGETFKGFPSGAVYLDVEANGTVGVTMISNQTFNNFVRDSITPLLMVNGSFSGSYVPGDEIVLPTATAYDVLNAVGDIKVMVRTAAGVTVAEGVADKELTFIPKDYGSYAVVYTVTDAAGNKISSTTTVVVVDNVKPTLTFSGEIPTTAAWGSTITAPTYTVSDNGDISKVVVKRYVCGPDGIMVAIKSDNKIVFNMKGEYTIYYFVVDENNNTANYTFYVTVK